MWSYIVFAAEFREPTNAHDVVNLDTRHPARLLKAYRGTYLERMEDLQKILLFQICLVYRYLFILYW